MEARPLRIEQLFGVLARVQIAARARVPEDELLVDVADRDETVREARLGRGAVRGDVRAAHESEPYDSDSDLPVTHRRYPPILFS